MLDILNYVGPSAEQWGMIIHGMRNPMNSWDRSDSVCTARKSNKAWFDMGENDHDLAMRLVKGGSVHAKYRRMIPIMVTVVAPLYWWKEFDTYKVGTVANSCSTMHKIHEREFAFGDFSCEHVGDVPNCDPQYEAYLEQTIDILNEARRCYLDTNDKKYWWQMIQLLPSSYNQQRTLYLNYEVLANIYKWRKNHKLDEWHTFCDWIEKLPYSELITYDAEKEDVKTGTDEENLLTLAVKSMLNSVYGRDGSYAVLYRELDKLLIQGCSNGLVLEGIDICGKETRETEE